MATYYVDATGGSDGAAGTSEGTAWQTISKVNGETFSAGDSILFKRGEVWRETLTPPDSGASGNPITFGAYGSGALPIINGADIYDENDWTAVPASVDTTSYPVDSTDDGWDSVAFATTGELLIFGNNTGNPVDAGFRFRNVAVPKDATITSAFIRITARYAFTADIATVIRGESNATPATFSTQGDFQGRTRTTAAVTWDPTANKGAGDQFDTVDISSIIEEITSLGGWASGNDLVLFVEDDGSGSNIKQYGSSVRYDSGSEKAELHVTYSSGVTNVYTMASPVADDLGVVVVVDGTLATRVANQVDLSGDYEYWVDRGESPNVIHLYSTTAPDSAVIEVSSRTDCVYASGKSYLTIEDLQVKYAAYAGVRLTGAVTGACVVDGVKAVGNRIFGIVAVNGHEDNVFQNCTATENGNGIYSSSSDGTQILNNVATDQVKYTVAPLTDGDGIGSFNSDATSIIGNVANDNQGDGIDVDGNASAVTVSVLRNFARGNGYESEGYGFGIGGMAGDPDEAVMAGNIATGNNTSGAHAEFALRGPLYFHHNTALTPGTGAAASISVFVVSGTVRLRNNIGRVTDGSAQRAIKIFAGATVDADYNLWHTEGGGDMSVVGSTASTWAEWQAAGYDADGVNSDPAFADEDGATAADFKLTEGSPAIGAGVDVSLASDYFGFSYRDPPDIGAHSYTSENASGSRGLPGHRAPWIGIGTGV